MRILIGRHALSDGNLDEKKYSEVGDSQVELAKPVGWQQAIAMGDFWKGYCNQHTEILKSPVEIYSTPYLRGRQTMAGAIEGSDGYLKKENYHVDPLLVEISFGILNYLSEEERETPVFKKLLAFSRLSHQQDPFTGARPLGESPSTTKTRMDVFKGALMRAYKEGAETQFVMCHGVTARMLIMSFMKIDPIYYKNFPNPENCSLYCIEGDIGKGRYYTLHQIYNGETRQPVSIDWGTRLHAHEAWLPPVPEEFRLRPTRPAPHSAPVPPVPST